MKKVRKLVISVIGILVFVCSVGAFSSYAISKNVSTDSTPIGAFETAFTALKECLTNMRYTLEQTVGLARILMEKERSIF